MKEANKNYFLFVGLFVFIVLAIIFGRAVFSYDTNIAHPFLAKQAVALFNQSAANKLSGEEAEWIMQGAVEEDTPIRWMNHFYDPITGFGLPGFSPANVWAKQSLAQLGYLMGDQSWQTAILFYTARQ